jgi:hypothetical protein
MRRANGQILDEIAERLDELTGVPELTQHVELTEGVWGDGAISQGTQAVVRDEDDESQAIEFITESGFSIFRPWESGKSPRPTDGRYHFAVSDGFIEREVAVEISHRVLTEISLRTRGRIEMSNSFWICCAERHLANYVSERADFPDNDELIVEELKPEDILLALRWDKSG